MLAEALRRSWAEPSREESRARPLTLALALHSTPNPNPNPKQESEATTRVQAVLRGHLARTASGKRLEHQLTGGAIQPERKPSWAESTTKVILTLTLTLTLTLALT